MTSKKKPTEPEANEPVPEPTPQERAARCLERVQRVLKEDGCYITPRMFPEQIGSGPMTRMIVDADWGVLPNEARQ